MNWFSIIEGIIIGAVGGAGAGISIWLLNLWREGRIEKRDRERVYKWLLNNSGNSSGYKFRSTRAIASHTNLTLESVDYICSTDEEIHLSTGERDDVWELKSIVRNSERE